MYCIHIVSTFFLPHSLMSSSDICLYVGLSELLLSCLVSSLKILVMAVQKFCVTQVQYSTHNEKHHEVVRPIDSITFNR